MMYDLFKVWIGFSGIIDDGIMFIFTVVASLFILNFILDFFRFLLYYITRR